MLWIEKKRLLSVMLTLLIAIEIFWISSLPGTKGQTEIPFVAVTYHLCVFFLFGFFLFFSLKGKNEPSGKHFIFSILFSLAYAISDELHQSFVPLRDASSGDILTDFIGMGFSIIVAFLMSKKSNRQA